MAELHIVQELSAQLFQLSATVLKQSDCGERTQHGIMLWSDILFRIVLLYYNSDAPRVSPSFCRNSSQLAIKHRTTKNFYKTVIREKEFKINDEEHLKKIIQTTILIKKEVGIISKF